MPLDGADAVRIRSPLVAAGRLSRYGYLQRSATDCPDVSGQSRFIGGVRCSFLIPDSIQDGTLQARYAAFA